MSNQRPSYHAVLNLKPRCFPSRKAFAAVPATVLMVLLYVSCVFSDDSDVFQVVIGPELRECGGQGDMKCMMVNGELFMGVIENFEYMEGYDYILKVEKFDAWTDEEAQPEDIMKFGYRLIEVVRRTPRM